MLFGVSTIIVWGLVLLQLTKDDFALPNLAPKLVDLAKEVTLGRGFQLLK